MFIALGEQHLHQVLKSYANYYNASRTHRRRGDCAGERQHCAVILAFMTGAAAWPAPPWPGMQPLPVATATAGRGRIPSSTGPPPAAPKPISYVKRLNGLLKTLSVDPVALTRRCGERNFYLSLAACDACPWRPAGAARLGLATFVTQNRTRHGHNQAYRIYELASKRSSPRQNSGPEIWGKQRSSSKTTVI